MSKLLLNEQPLLIMPELATKIGLNESLILQQVHYWNEINRLAKNNLRDGDYWTFNSYNNWRKQFPFWSVSTIKRTISKLEKSGLLIVGNYNKLKIDRTKWYRIDYKALEVVENTPIGQIDPTKVSKRTKQECNMNRPLPETNSEINSETNYLQFSEKTGFLLSFLEKTCKNKFDRTIRKHTTDIDLDLLYDVAVEYEDEFYEFIHRRIKTYDNCSLEYLKAIQGEFAPELYEHY